MVPSAAFSSPLKKKLRVKFANNDIQELECVPLEIEYEMYKKEHYFAVAQKGSDKLLLGMDLIQQ